MTAQRSLADWLAAIEQMHPQSIEMGLERVAQVYARLPSRLACAVITVGGTNGKGSTCAMLEAILRHAGYRVGLYTSPHLWRFNERARIDGESATDEQLSRCFEIVEEARGGTQLTYFEFTTLAILQFFAEASLDVAILEVGLGGRLDAINILDADVAIVTNVDIDHAEYLGDTRGQIGFEKAGIFRSGRPAICGEAYPPPSLIDYANKIGADLWLAGRDFRSEEEGGKWCWRGRDRQRDGLDYPRLQGSNQIGNASAALAALESLRDRLPVSDDAVRAGLAQAVVPGRFEILPGRPMVILDVAHNPHAAAVLADNLAGMGPHRHVYAVFGAMRDKDITAIIDFMQSQITHWHVTDLPLPRAADASDIAERLTLFGIGRDDSPNHDKSVRRFSSPAVALREALSRAGENDKIVVFGSFWTVAGATEADINRYP